VLEDNHHDTKTTESNLSRLRNEMLKQNQLAATESQKRRISGLGLTFRVLNWKQGASHPGFKACR
jgi:hypothetical protein